MIGRSPHGDLPFGFEIPFGIMVPQEVEGLLVPSGKSVSTEPVGLVRGMSRCMTLGEAAGVAAALGARQGVSPDKVPIRDIQLQLVSQGAYLGEPDRPGGVGGVGGVSGGQHRAKLSSLRFSGVL